MKGKTKNKKILSMVLAWMLIAANVLSGMTVQAAELAQPEVVVEELDAMEEVVVLTEDMLETSEVVPEVENEEVTVVEETTDVVETYATVANKTEYEIYPTPHSMVYGKDGYEIGEVNLVYDSTIDQVTKNRMEEILTSKEIIFTVTEAAVEGKTNILIGTYSATDKGYVQTQLEAVETVTEADFEGFTAHFVVSKDNTIYVLGEDTDAAFYGVTTLKHVFAQMEGNTIRNFTVKDFADVNIRGFIEGYYGIPWSNEDRMSLMKFGGEFKMTSYIFAPKDDPYHKELWRDLYPEEEFEAIKEMVAVGNASKCRFVWTAHPFMGGFNAGDATNEIQRLLTKFDQLYDAGVRQFGVLGDDVGALDKNIIINMMNAVSDWAEEKGDVYDTVFCPAGYNHSWQGDYSELNTYDAGFPDDIQIFWTGEAVCQPIEVKTLNHFMNHNFTATAEKASRRAPLFWLNWPVNDINHSRMLLGKGSLLHTDVDPATLAGAVTNPMQEAESSKNALFAVADYTWNIANFDDDTSWVDGFKYIEPDATEELFILANHMSDPSPNGHGLVLEESANIKDMLDAYFANGTYGNELKAEFEKIVAACDGFHAKSKNENFKEELLPFTNSLKDLVNAAICFIDTQTAIEEGNEDLTWSSYSQASAYLGKSKTYYKKTLSDPEIVDPASKRIIPFVEGLNAKLAPIVMSMVDDSKQFITFQTNRTDLTSSALDVILDNNEGTQVISKSPASIAVGDYVGITFTKAIELNTVTFKMGQSGNPRDTFTGAKVQYTEDGKNWVDIADSEYNDNRATVNVENLDLLVKGVRLIATTDRGNTWLGIKDILINGKGLYEVVENEGVEKYSGSLFYTEEYSVYSGSASDVFDGSDESFIWFGNTCAAGDYVGVDFGEEVTIGKIHFAMPSGDDRMTSYKLRYSTDGQNWTDIGNYTDRIVDVNLGEAITARYICAYNNNATGKWLKIAEFAAWEPEKVEVYTNKDISEVAGMAMEIGSDFATLSGTVTLQAGEYVGVDLGRIKDITSITAAYAGNVAVQTSKNEVVWEEYNLNSEVTTFEDARYVRFINNTEREVSLTVTSLEVRSHEIYPISVLDTNFGNAGTHLLAFDQDRTSQAVLQASQYAGQYITYDLGQVIDLESLKLVLHDTTTDYPRHAKVSVSLDNETWETVMLIGNQDSNNEGEAENTDSIFDLFPVHETSYNTLLAENIGKEVRYIKFEITRNKAGADKWVRINEIELNGGNMFIPDVNDPTIGSDAKESNGNTFSNMIDGDVATIYTPVENADGNFTYNIPGDTAISQVSILQNPATISNALVTAQVVEGGVEKEVVLGNLTGSLNRFDTEDYTSVNTITVEWTKDNLPGIYEIILKRKEDSSDVQEIIKEITNFTITGTLDKDYDGTPVTTTGITVEGLEDASNVTYKFYDNSQGIVALTEVPSDAGRYWVRAVVENDGTVVAKSNLLSFLIKHIDVTVADITLDKEYVVDKKEVVRVTDISFEGLVDGEVFVENEDYTIETSMKVEGEKALVTIKVVLTDSEKARKYAVVNKKIVKELEYKTLIRVLGVQDLYYNGNKLTQDIKVYDGKELLKEGTDYTVSYKNNQNVYPLVDGMAGYNKNKEPQVTVKMKGNYSGTQTLYFKIKPAKISGEAFAAADIIVTNTEKVQTAKPVLTFNGKALKLGKDFEVTASDELKGAGTYTLTLTGRGNFEGTRTINFTISESKNQIVMDKVAVSGVKAQNYTGENITLTGVKVKYKGNDLIVNEEYTVNYANNKAAGTASLILTGTGSDTNLDGYSFVGSKTVTFKINGTDMKKVTIAGIEKGYDYAYGNEIVPDYKLSFNKTDLVEKTHYEVNIDSNTEKGTATVTFTGKPEAGYTGSKVVKFKVNAKSLADATVTLKEEGSVAILKGGSTPKVKVISGKTTLTEGVDYTVSYQNNKKVAAADAQKAPTVVVTGKGNYTGKNATLKFAIVEKALTNDNGIVVVANDKVPTGKAGGWKQTFKVYDADGKALSNKNDYNKTATYWVEDEDGTMVEATDSNVKVGDIIEVRVTGLGSYQVEGEEAAYATGTYRLIKNGYDISKANIKVNGQAYTGKPILITKQSQLDGAKTFIKNGKEKVYLQIDTHIKAVAYDKNDAKGTAKVTFEGVGEYGGTKTVTFKIGQRSILDWFEDLFK